MKMSVALMCAIMITAVVSVTLSNYNACGKRACALSESQMSLEVAGICPATFSTYNGWCFQTAIGCSNWPNQVECDNADWRQACAVETGVTSDPFGQGAIVATITCHGQYSSGDCVWITSCTNGATHIGSPFPCGSKTIRSDC